MLVTCLVELFFAGQLHSDDKDVTVISLVHLGQDSADHARDLAGVELFFT